MAKHEDRDEICLNNKSHPLLSAGAQLSFSEESEAETEAVVTVALVVRRLEMQYNEKRNGWVVGIIALLLEIIILLCNRLSMVYIDVI